MLISDNGKGFELIGPKGQHLGLGIMNERAREIEARVEVSSAPGAGTTIRVEWDAKNNTNKSNIK